MDLGVAAEEMEGFSDNLPKGEAFCGLHDCDPSSRSCVSRTCIPGNQENATSFEPMGSLGPIRRSPAPCWVRRDHLHRVSWPRGSVGVGVEYGNRGLIRS
jgi:hypothetical protein